MFRLSFCFACSLLIPCKTAFAQFSQLERPDDISTWIEITIAPDFSDSTPLVLFGPEPDDYVQTNMFWMPYARGGFDMIHDRFGATVFSGPVLGGEIFAGVHAVTITRLGDPYPPNRHLAQQDFRYESPAGVRMATHNVVVQFIPEPATWALLATAVAGVVALRRRR